MNKNFEHKGVLLAILMAGMVIGFFLKNSGINQSFESAASSLDKKDNSWKKIPLQTVEGNKKFTISGLEKPLLVETFAVWCTTCSRQQQEIKKLHDKMNVTSVSLNVDPNENENKVLKHKQKNGFHWRYAISPIELTNKLRNKFGNSIANPPSAPVILVCENRTIRLRRGSFGSPVKSANFLEKKIREICLKKSVENRKRDLGAET